MSDKIILKFIDMLEGDMEKNYMETARAFKSLCDPQRLKILDMLNREDLCACDILE